MIRAFWLTMLAAVLLVSAGCRSTSNRPFFCCRKDPPAPNPVFVPPPPPSPAFPISTIQQSGATLSPGAVVTPPPGANVIQPGPAPSISKSPPAIWQPGERVDPSQRDVPPRIQLYAPEPIDKETPKPSGVPPLDKKPGAQTAFPAIPQFAQAFDKVYAGLRPPLDGLDWLQANGVQTVVQIRLFGEDDSADRKQVEKRNMRYVAFEVSPVVLTREKTDEFVKLIRDGAKQGVFVYDQDGSLAGAMWYLHMRFGEFLEDDASRLRAGQLGLQPTGEGQHREMWLAARKLASENSR